MNVPVLRWGLSHADDAATAYVAKNIAAGRGYGFPQSHDQFVVFGYMITSIGPTLILPVAFLVWLFGPVDQLPGAATLVIFLGQLIVAAIILSRRFGWTPTCGFLSATIWLLMLAIGNWWLFGSLLGEPVTFGFILIGTACLVVAKRDRGIAAAALCLSLALVTKLIALFPVAGIVGALLIISTYDRVGRTVLFRRAVILLLVTSSLPFTFEATKLVTLGLAGYRDRFRETLNITLQMGVGSGDQSARLTTFRTIFLESYISATLLAMLVTGSVLLLVLSRRSRDKGLGGVERFAILAWSGAAVHLAYILLVSSLWPRYFWIGIAILLTAICAPLLAVGSRLRVATILVLLVGTVGFGFHRPLLRMREWISNSRAPAERAVVVRLLDDHPQLPYAAQGWSSISDVLYLRREEGIWAYEPNVIRLQDRDFIALINDVFTVKEGRFFKSVVMTCEPLTPQGRLTAYSCGERFWGMYSLSASSPKSPVGVALPYHGVVDRRDCETVAGWVMTSADSEADIKVDLYIDDKLAETVPARNLRPDLSGKVGTGRYGFSFKIPAAYKDERPHLVNVKVVGSEYTVPFLQGVFSSFECKLY